MFDAAIEIDSQFPSAWLGKAFSEIALVSDENFNSLTIDEYLNRSLETNLPGGMSEVRFMFSIAQRIKSFESKTNYNPRDLKWSESIYKAVDDAMVISDDKKFKYQM